MGGAPRPGWTRRGFLASLGAAALAPAACSPTPSEPEGGSARLRARPGLPATSIAPGTYLLPLEPGGRDAWLLVPAGYVPGTPMPLVLALHGAAGDAGGPVELLRPYAESRGFLVLAVDSLGGTWDVLLREYGPDVAFIDAALAQVFVRCSVDPARVAVEGFSDGASYALGLGIANGDLFRRIVAFSPGRIPASGNAPIGRPAVFVSHGRQDPVLLIDAASRAIVADLRSRGYAVDFHEFDGGHEIPAAVASLAAGWLVG